MYDADDNKINCAQTILARYNIFDACKIGVDIDSFKNTNYS
jgi:hypothetical protein